MSDITAALTGSVSATFHPHVILHEDKPPDLALTSTDHVSFYVHRAVLLAVSPNGLGGLIPAVKDSSKSLGTGMPHSVQTDLDAAALNVVLHVVYHLSFAHFYPDFSTLSRATAALFDSYGLATYVFVAPATPLYGALLSQAVAHGPTSAMQVYILAAKHGLEALAIGVSEQLLSFEMSSLTDEQAAQLGGLYLKRLFLLLLARIGALKQLLVVEPGPLHPPIPICGQLEQRRDVLAPWAYAVAHLIADARPDTPSALLESTLNPVAYRCACASCRLAIQERVRVLVIEWSAVKRTI
ncbi:hypothetical protein BKA62DRAFT_716422 [Auriculariales sp. MPI-PUGE-AT-0066]|nr:hypothetical protein BKA62DRAFT_716422 [Auriculariales sp. MPI-PUGE-AT-0066]